VTAVLGDITREFSARVDSGKTNTQNDSACRDLPDVPTTGILDGQICNTMKAFAASEIGIKPGMAMVTAPTQARIMAILHAFAEAAEVAPGNAKPARANIIATDRR
jgi:hypothetical protein